MYEENDDDIWYNEDGSPCEPRVFTRVAGVFDEMDNYEAMFYRSRLVRHWFVYTDKESSEFRAGSRNAACIHKECVCNEAWWEKYT